MAHVPLFLSNGWSGTSGQPLYHYGLGSPWLMPIGKNISRGKLKNVYKFADYRIILYFCTKSKTPGVITSIVNLGEGLTETALQRYKKKMEYSKSFFEKVFSEDRMKKYFSLYPHNESMAIKH